MTILCDDRMPNVVGTELTLVNILAFYLSFLPSKALIHALNKTVFIMAEPARGGIMVHAEEIAGRDIILLPWEFLKRPKAEKLEIIAHEIAHSYLGQDPEIKDHFSEAYDRQEKRCWALVEEWLASHGSMSSELVLKS